MTPGCRSVRNFRAAFFANGSRDLFEFTSKVNKEHEALSSCVDSALVLQPQEFHTFFVPLCKENMDSPASTLSPIITGNELDLAIADATADFKKSIDGHSLQQAMRSNKG